MNHYDLLTLILVISVFINGLLFRQRQTMKETIKSIADQLAEAANTARIASGNEQSTIQRLHALSARLESLQHMDSLTAWVLPLVEQFDKESQSGEWKFHQVYAKALKTPEGQRLAQLGEKWKVGVAIHQALRVIRLKGEA